MSKYPRRPIVSPHREVVPTSFDADVLPASPASTSRELLAELRTPRNAAFRPSAEPRSLRRLARAPSPATIRRPLLP